MIARFTLEPDRANLHPVDPPPNPSLPVSAAQVEKSGGRFHAEAPPGGSDNPPVARATDPQVGRITLCRGKRNAEPYRAADKEDGGGCRFLLCPGNRWDNQSEQGHCDPADTAFQSFPRQRRSSTLALSPHGYTYHSLARPDQPPESMLLDAVSPRDTQRGWITRVGSG